MKSLLVLKTNDYIVVAEKSLGMGFKLSLLNREKSQLQRQANPKCLYYHKYNHHFLLHLRLYGKSLEKFAGKINFSSSKATVPKLPTSREKRAEGTSRAGFSGNYQKISTSNPQRPAFTVQLYEGIY